MTWTDSTLAELAAELWTGDAPAPAALSVRRAPSGKYNSTFFVDGGPRPLVLRIAPPDDRARNLFYEHRMMRQEPPIHERLRAQTDCPVPRIFAFVEQHPAIGRDVMLMERCDGTALSDGYFGAGAMERAFEAVGRCLAQAHALEGPAYGYVGPHQPMTPRGKWVDAFVVMWNLLLDDIEACGGYTTAEAATLRRKLDRHAALFDRPVKASLLHMDVWAQNILARPDGTLTGLIDWDRALFGDPEIEFAVLDYCGVSVDAFWRGYGCERDLGSEARIRNAFYLLYELQKYIVIRTVRSGSPERARGYRDQALAIAERL